MFRSEVGGTNSNRARKAHLGEIQTVIIDTAFRYNKPGLLEYLSEIDNSHMETLFSRMIGQYIQTNDTQWLNSVFMLSQKIKKKSTQSKIFAVMAQDLIASGVNRSDASLIEQGMTMLDEIGFQKYRSESMIDIIPLLIVRAVTSKNVGLLVQSLDLINEISDISKRAVLHADIAMAMGAIAILEKDISLFYQSIHSSTDIHQKIRRQECIESIIENGAKSGFAKDLLDIPAVLQHFADVNTELQREIIHALTEQVLERSKDMFPITAILEKTCITMPFASETVILALLKKAEKSGDNWYLVYATELQKFLPKEGKYPLREIVRAGMAIARHTKDMTVLSDLMPLIEKTCNASDSSRIYLQFSQIMLACDDYSRSIGMLENVRNKTENLAQFIDCLSVLLKYGIFNDAISQVYESLLKTQDDTIVLPAIIKTITEVNRDALMADIVNHLDSYKELILMHPGHDQIILDSITMIINRGFLDSQDSTILVRLAESITDSAVKERAISTIVIKIAKIGVRTKNRDFLQRAVGITCLIEDQNTRSATLSSIIDEASLLAALQGDLDLLLRMRVWSSSLLDASLVAYTMANIIEGIIKYATDTRSPDALEEAYLIAKDINDPSLKMQMCERIAECFVRIGCNILKSTPRQLCNLDDPTVLQPFIRGLEILKNEMKKPQISLKIAGMIDAILVYSRSSSNSDYVIPLTLFSVEIENSFERDAMMSRIVTSLNEYIAHPDSPDPYENLAFLIQINPHSKLNPVLIDLKYQLLKKISDPYIKLNGMCNLADTCIRLQDNEHANRVLQEVWDSVLGLGTNYQKIMVLADLTIVYSHHDREKAKLSLEKGLLLLKNVEPGADTMARRQMVYALVRLNDIQPDLSWIDLALQIIANISDPEEYIDALIAASEMIRSDKERFVSLIRQMSKSAEKITFPYDRASMILKIIPLALQSSHDKIALSLLRNAEHLSEKINIPYIADTIRENIVRMYSMFHHQSAEKTVFDAAISVIKTIEDDQLQIQCLHKMGYGELPEHLSVYVKIKMLYIKMISNGVQPNNVASLERLVRSVADRGKEATFFCNLAILSRNNGEQKLSRKMLQNAVKEAAIIRPLSRRAYILCDIAMRISAAGYETESQDILDDAMDAATNIRQSALRDEVFNELGLAIRIMQRPEP
ncbi:MAG: hypothetical protein WC391_00640 [Methanoregula sp.]